MRGCVGTGDRVIRALLGLALLGLAVAIHAGQPWAYAAGIVAIISVVTGLVGRCPLYVVAGLNTSRGLTGTTVHVYSA
jgi:hypothetical protein